MGRKETSILFLGALVVVLLAGFTLAANFPTAPESITEITESTFNPDNYAPQSHDAIAGNVTAINMYAIGQTKSWQGYYGNITATITLDDANNNTFYNWSAAEPRGEIYATLNTTIDWGGVDCFDFTATGGDANETIIETYYTIATDDVDGVAETYTATDHPSFEVGSRTMTLCPTTYVFRDDAAQTSDFVNVLLYDATIPETGWIYTTLMENKTAGSTNDLTCFNGEECDFQIFVNEDGHGTDVSTTTYYFWVELS